MPKGPRIESDDDDLGKDTGKSSKGKEPKKKSDAQSAREEQARRLAELRKEQKESQESTRHTQKEANRVSGKHEKHEEPTREHEFAKQEPMVEQSDNGTIYVYNISDASPENILKAIEEAGFEFNTKMPSGFEKWDFDQQLAWYKEQGVRVLPSLRGGAPGDPLDLAAGALGAAASTGGLPLEVVSGARFAREIQRENNRTDPATGADLEPRLEKLVEMNQALEAAILEGRLDDQHAAIVTQLNTLRNELASKIEDRTVAAEVARRADAARLQTERTAEAGYLDFNEYFGAAYKDTKRYIEGVKDPSTGAVITLPDAIGLRTRLEEVEDWALNKVLSHHVADPEKETDWPSPTEVNKETIRKFFEVARALNQEVGLNGREGIRALLESTGMASDRARKLLESFVSLEVDVSLKHRINNYFDNIYKNIGEKKQDAIAGDIKENAGPATNSIAAGWQEFNPRMKRLFEVVDTDRGLAGSKLALREWRGMYVIEGVEQNVRFVKLTQPPEHPADVPEAIYKLINAVEPTGQSPQDLQATIQAAYGMLTRIDTTTDEGRAMHFEMKELLEAFKFKQSFIITAHVKSLNPEALQHVYDEIEGNLESTFTSMISRFERDGRGRQWWAKNEATGEIEKFNMFDESKRLYSERLREDRIKMNMVEEMTKYSIDSEFGPGVISGIQRAVGYGTLPADWRNRIVENEEFDKYGLDPTWRDRTKWEVALESTRRWMIDRINYRIAHDKVGEKFHGQTLSGVLDAWGIDSNRHGVSDLRHGFTKPLIQNWYERKTLHGAYGVIDNEGLREVVSELKHVFRKRLSPTGEPEVWETDAQVEDRLRRKFGEGPTWLQVRKEELRQRLRNKLGEIELSADRNIKFGHHGAANLKKMEYEDLEDLLDTGYIAAVDNNAHDLTWVFEWSDYHFIHIYGKNSDPNFDDFKALVNHRSSDNYFAMIIDHSWEYMHEDFEDRGRERRGDVDETFKKHFAGKHNWLFGHVSMGARFINSFLTVEDQELLERRTEKLVGKYEYYRHDGPYRDDYEDFLRGVAKRELIAEGAISFADKKYSEIVKQRNSFNKFNPIDNAADRNLVLKFMGPGMIQSYLANPEASKFEKITTKAEGFMSTRNPRLFPWMEFGLRAHWDVVHNLKYKMFGEPDVTNKEMENFVENMAAGGHIEPEQAEEFIKENLGIGPGIFSTVPFRLIRSWWETEKKESQITRQRSLIRLLFFLLWELPFQITIPAITKGVGEDLKKTGQH